MSEFFLELFSEEIPAGLQINLREKLLKEFQKFFLEKSVKSKKNFSLSTPNRLIIVFEGLDKQIETFSEEIKAERKNVSKGTKDFKKYLTNKVVALLFKKPSTRTRFSFEVGISQMGGQSITVSSNEMQLSNFESMSDTARVLSQYLDMVVIRTDNHSDLMDLTKYSNIPIINGLSDKSHPCQVLSDIFTFEEIIGSIEGKKVVWLGDSNNVCNSYIQASNKLNFELVISGPREFLSSEIKSSPKYQYEMHPERALQNADLIVTDTWYSMHHTKEERKHTQCPRQKMGSNK